MVAGILLALVVPVRSRIDPRRFLERTERDLAALKEGDFTRESMISDARQFSASTDLTGAASAARPTGLRFGNSLHAGQVFIVLRLFAFFNAGVSLGGEVVETLRSPISLGTIAGLVLRKRISVTLFSWLAETLAGATGLLVLFPPCSPQKLAPSGDAFHRIQRHSLGKDRKCCVLDVTEKRIAT